MPTPSRGHHLRRLTTTLAATVAALGTLVATALASYAVTGIDVSSHQHYTTLNWSKVKADGISFAFVKATEGRTYTNPYFAGDWRATRNNGIYRGAYHFARPSKGTAFRQARFFAATVGATNRPGDLPPVLDLEVTGGLGPKALRTWTRNWLETVRELTGRIPTIYVSPYFWRTHLGNSQRFTKYRLWVAHYGVSRPDVPGGWKTWTFWQRTSSGRVAGISGRVDMNRFHGTAAGLARLALTRTGGTTDPTPTGATAPTSPRPVTKQETTTSLRVSTGVVYRGNSLTVSGRFATASGRAIAGRSISLLRRTEGKTAWVKVASLETDRNGRFTSRRSPRRSVSFKAVWPGGIRYKHSASPARSVTVRPKRHARIELEAGKSSVRRGAAVRLSGHLTSGAGTPLNGRRVTVYKRARGTTTWTEVRSVSTVRPTGWYQTDVRPMRVLTYKAVFGGTAKYEPATSDLVTVTIIR